MVYDVDLTLSNLKVEVWQRESAAEMLACRFEVSDLQRQCGELRGELVQAQAKCLSPRKVLWRLISRI